MVCSSQPMQVEKLSLRVRSLIQCLMQKKTSAKDPQKLPKIAGEEETNKTNATNKCKLDGLFPY